MKCNRIVTFKGERSTDLVGNRARQVTFHSCALNWISFTAVLRIGSGSSAKAMIILKGLKNLAKVVVSKNAHLTTSIGGSKDN